MAQRHNVPSRRPSFGGWLMRLELTYGKLAFTTAQAPDWQIVLTPAPVPDHFTIAPAGKLSGENVTFEHLPYGRVASVHLMDSTWVRLDRVTT